MSEAIIRIKYIPLIQSQARAVEIKMIIYRNHYRVHRFGQKKKEDAMIGHTLQKVLSIH